MLAAHLGARGRDHPYGFLGIEFLPGRYPYDIHLESRRCSGACPRALDAENKAPNLRNPLPVHHLRMGWRSTFQGLNSLFSGMLNLLSVR